MSRNAATITLNVGQERSAARTNDGSSAFGSDADICDSTRASKRPAMAMADHASLKRVRYADTAAVGGVLTAGIAGWRYGAWLWRAPLCFAAQGAHISAFGFADGDEMQYRNSSTPPRVRELES